MSSKSHLTKDQKRKAKLKERAKRQAEAPLPYSGEKYRAEKWLPHVSATELAVYETILLSKRQLTNEQVRTSFCQLIEHLRDGQPALLPHDAPIVEFAPGHEAEYLVWNIRRHWVELTQKHGPVSCEDLIGILRTLLYSIKAQAWAHGASLGYVYFLYGFMQRVGF